MLTIRCTILHLVVHTQTVFLIAFDNLERFVTLRFQRLVHEYHVNFWLF